jgi:hypothetical protein
MKTLTASISGFVSWKEESYSIDDALSKSRLGLKPIDSGIHEEYFAERLIEKLHEATPNKISRGKIMNKVLPIYPDNLRPCTESDGIESRSLINGHSRQAFVKC